MQSGDHAAVLAGALPADPDDHGPVAVPSDALRGALSELVALRRGQGAGDAPEGAETP